MMGKMVYILFSLVTLNSIPRIEGQGIDFNSFPESAAEISQTINTSATRLQASVDQLAGSAQEISNTFTGFYNLSQVTQPELLEIAYRALNISTDFENSTATLAQVAAEYTPQITNAAKTAADGIQSIGNIAQLVIDYPTQTFFVVVAAWTASRVLSEVVFKGILVPTWDGCVRLAKKAKTPSFCLKFRKRPLTGMPAGTADSTSDGASAPELISAPEHDELHPI